jgi:predicted enzyme related to lactoylglutathione lyase
MAVTGIGGLFFRAANPEALTAWYDTHFGITMKGYDPWVQQAGPTVFMPFAADSTHLPAGKQWMLNLRVDDLDAQLAALRDAGIAITTDPAWDSPETGRFARVFDPEGNAIELWEPPLE